MMDKIDHILSTPWALFSTCPELDGLDSRERALLRFLHDPHSELPLNTYFSTKECPHCRCGQKSC
jgi:hypothetical protein